MSLVDDIQNKAKEYGATGNSSDFFQFEKGQNKVRILARPEVLATHFFGKGNPSVVCVGVDEGCSHHKDTDQKPSLKLATYVIDRKDGNVKLAELPLSVSYSLNDLQEDEDYSFDDFPMPYDVKITYDPDNDDPKAKYRLVGSPKREELTEEERKAFDEAMEKMTPEQYVEKRKAKSKEKVEYPEPPKGDVPF